MSLIQTNIYVRYALLLASFIIMPTSSVFAELDIQVTTSQASAVVGSTSGNRSITHDDVSNEIDANSEAKEVTFDVRYLTKSEHLNVVYTYPELFSFASVTGDDEPADVYRHLGIIFDFATVEGRINGRVTGDTLLQLPTTKTDKLTLTLPASIPAKNINIFGLDINTFGKSVQIARLSTTAMATKNQTLLKNGASLIDVNNATFLVLVYTSSPVDIQGTLLINGQPTTYDISLPSQGWHWVSYAKKDNGYLLQLANPDTIDPAILAF